MNDTLACYRYNTWKTHYKMRMIIGNAPSPMLVPDGVSGGVNISGLDDKFLGTARFLLLCERLNGKH